MPYSVRAILVFGIHPRQSKTTSLAATATRNIRSLERIFILRCGPKGHELLVTQGHYRIYLRGAAGGDVTGEQCHTEQDHADYDER